MLWRFAAATLMAVALVGCGTTATVTTTGPELPLFESGSEIAVGETYSFLMTVGCGEGIDANGQRWVVERRNFDHPNYPPDWPVTIKNLGPVDGPDAFIEATLTLVDTGHISIALADGTPVADYVPGEPFLCG